MKAFIEHTDTFGGEANYSWVDRLNFTCDGLTDNQIVRKAKRLLGFTGIRCNKEEFGDMITLRPAGWCQVIFITFGDNDDQY